MIKVSKVYKVMIVYDDKDGASKVCPVTVLCDNYAMAEDIASDYATEQHFTNYRISEMSTAGTTIGLTTK